MVNCIVRFDGGATFNYKKYFCAAPKVMPPDANSKNTRRCSRLYREGFLTVSRPFGSTRWREIAERPVLAPLAVKQNSDNIANNIAMNKKRKLNESAEYLSPKRKKLVNSNDNNDERSERKLSMRMLSLKFSCMLNKSTVKLFDVFREIPIVPEVEKPVHKNEYLELLGLAGLGNPPPKQICDVKIHHPITLTNCTGIPFSSNCGRRILLKRHGLSEEAALKKLDRTEWHLNNAEVIKKSCDVEITPVKDCTHVRLYSFPKRQFSQRHQSLNEAFQNYVCKPVCVEVERFDFSAIRLKNNNNNNETVVNAVEEGPTIASSMEISVNCAIIKRGYIDDKSSDINNSDSNLISPLVYANNTDMFRQTDELAKLKLRLSDSRTSLNKTSIFRLSDPKIKLIKPPISRRSPRLKQSL